MSRTSQLCITKADKVLFLHSWRDRGSPPEKFMTVKQTTSFAALDFDMRLNVSFLSVVILCPCISDAKTRLGVKFVCVK